MQALPGALLTWRLQLGLVLLRVGFMAELLRQRQELLDNHGPVRVARGLLQQLLVVVICFRFTVQGNQPLAQGQPQPGEEWRLNNELFAEFKIEVPAYFWPAAPKIAAIPTRGNR